MCVECSNKLSYMDKTKLIDSCLEKNLHVVTILIDVLLAVYYNYIEIYSIELQFFL